MRKGKALKVQVAYNILHHFESGLQRNKTTEKTVLYARLLREMKEVCTAHNEKPEG